MLNRYNLPLDSDKESNLGLTIDEEVAGLLGSSLTVNNCLIGSSVLLGILLGVSESKLSRSRSVGLSLGHRGLLGLHKLLVSGQLFLNVLWNGSSTRAIQTQVSLIGRA